MEIWQVWLEKKLIGSFEARSEALAWVKRYAPECIIKEVKKEEA